MTGGGMDANSAYGRCPSMALMDAVAAINAAAAVVTAPRCRKATGQGAFVEMALHESGVSFCGPWLVEHQFGNSIERLGNRHPGMVPHGVYGSAAEDEWRSVPSSGDLTPMPISQLDDMTARISTMRSLSPRWPTKRAKGV